MKSFRSLARFTLIVALCLAGPSMARAQEPGPEETVAYQTWYAANAANLPEKAIESAKDYLAKFPKGRYAPYLKGWLLGPKLKAFDAAVQAGKTDEMIKAGRDILIDQPENLGVSSTIAFNLRRVELAASPANFTHAKEASEFSDVAVKLIEAGKILEGGKFNKDASLALLFHIQALVEAQAGRDKEAIALYSKSSAADPGNAPIVSYNLLALASLHRKPYDVAFKAYQGMPEADRRAAEPSAEAKAALEAVNTTANSLIDSWARYVALARARNLAADTRDQVLASLQSVYSTRYTGDTSGLEPLLEKLKAEYAPKP